MPQHTQLAFFSQLLPGFPAHFQQFGTPVAPWMSFHPWQTLPTKAFAGLLLLLPYL